PRLNRRAVVTVVWRRAQQYNAAGSHVEGMGSQGPQPPKETPEWEKARQALASIQKEISSPVSSGKKSQQQQQQQQQQHDDATAAAAANNQQMYPWYSYGYGYSVPPAYNYYNQYQMGMYGMYPQSPGQYMMQPGYHQQPLQTEDQTQNIAYFSPLTSGKTTMEKAENPLECALLGRPFRSRRVAPSWASPTSHSLHRSRPLPSLPSPCSRMCRRIQQMPYTEAIKSKGPQLWQKKQAPGAGNLKFNIPKRPLITSNSQFNLGPQPTAEPPKPSPAQQPMPTETPNRVQWGGARRALPRPGDWPKAMKAYVERCFATCETEEDKDRTERLLKELLTARLNDGSAYTIDWTKEALPNHNRDASERSPRKASRWMDTMPASSGTPSLMAAITPRVPTPSTSSAMAAAANGYRNKFGYRNVFRSRCSSSSSSGSKSRSRSRTPQRRRRR
uniref:Leukocyte receptor cluster (LRC) member 8 n=1 Tax=Petromyzon marinus TaxID=7757 RepID=S4RP35_PETMA